MENNDNNLAHFFRNKLNSSEGLGEGWDRPEESVRDAVFEHIHTEDTAGFVYMKWIGLVLLLLATGLISWYIYTLNQKLNEAETALQDQQKQIENIQKETQRTTEIQVNKIEELKTQNKQLTSDYQNIIEDNTYKDQLLQKQRSSIIQTENHREEWQKNISNYESIFSHLKNEIDLLKAANIALIESDQTTKSRSKESAFNLSAIQSGLLVQKEKTLPNFEVATPILSTVSPLKKKKFELGYSYALRGVKMPIERSFERQRPASERVQDNRLVAHGHGINAGYNLGKNWWIRSGIQNTYIRIKQTFDLGLAYDPSNEMSRPDGSIENELALRTSTAYSDINSTFNIAFDPGQGLNDGDLLEVSVDDNLSHRRLQIPLGIAYIHENNKWRFALQGGVQWNNVSFRDYSFRTTVRARGEEIPVDRDRVRSSRIPGKQFMSTYTGFELGYQLKERWYAQTALNYNYDFINQRETEFSNASKTGTTLKIGLNYRF